METGLSKSEKKYCYLNKLKAINKKLEKSLLSCVYAKYDYDMNLFDEIENHRKSFVCSTSSIEKIGKRNLKSISELCDAIIIGVNTFSYDDIKYDKNFIIVLHKCLSSGYSLLNEYDNLINNLQDFWNDDITVPFDINMYYRFQDLIHCIEDTLVNSSWKHIDYLQNVTIVHNKS